MGDGRSREMAPLLLLAIVLVQAAVSIPEVRAAARAKGMISDQYQVVYKTGSAMIVSCIGLPTNR